MMNLSNIPAPRQRRRKGAAAPKAVGRAAVYTRVSTEDQIDNGESLASQETACRAECAQRGLDVVAVYSDAGHSGGTLERPALDELRAAVAAGDVAAVVVYAVDRLSRRQADTLALLEEFAGHGVGIWSGSQNFETATSSGKAMIGFLAIFAELQREEIRARTRAALQRKQAAGEPVGRTPFGLQRGKRDGRPAYLPDAATWPVVERILSERAAGSTCQAIADRLNADSVPTATARRPTAKLRESRGIVQAAGKWHAATVAKLSRNRDVLSVAAQLG